MITCDKIFMKSYYNCVYQSIFRQPVFYNTPYIFWFTVTTNPASKVVQIRAALVPVPSPDKWGGLRQEGHPA